MIELDLNPKQKDLRIFALLQIAFFAVVGWMLHKRGYSSTIVGSVIGVSVLVGVLGAFAPSAIKWIYIAWMALVFPIGWIVSHVLLGAIYFGVFTPYAFVMRMRGRDRLGCTFDKNATTYWTAHTQQADTKRYFRQS